MVLELWLTRPDNDHLNVRLAEVFVSDNRADDPFLAHLERHPAVEPEVNDSRADAVVNILCRQHATMAQ